MAMVSLSHTHYIILEEYGNSVFIVTVQGTCTMHDVSQLFAVYQHYQTNDKLRVGYTTPEYTPVYN